MNKLDEAIKIKIAEIKLHHAIIKSMPSGKYIDFKFLRNMRNKLNRK